jgi:hypothetical protein
MHKAPFQTMNLHIRADVAELSGLLLHNSMVAIPCVALLSSCHLGGGSSRCTLSCEA